MRHYILYSRHPNCCLFRVPHRSEANSTYPWCLLILSNTFQHTPLFDCTKRIKSCSKAIQLMDYLNLKTQNKNKTKHIPWVPIDAFEGKITLDSLSKTICTLESTSCTDGEIMVQWNDRSVCWSDITMDTTYYGNGKAWLYIFKPCILRVFLFHFYWRPQCLYFHCQPSRLVFW